MGKRLAGTLLAVVLLICFGAAYGEEMCIRDSHDTRAY